WFEDDNASMPISSPYTTGSTIVYAYVGVGAWLSELVEFTLVVVESPLVNPATDEACDDGNGTATFDLTALEATFNVGTASPVDWFEDDNASFPISSPYTTGSTIVYAVVIGRASRREVVAITVVVVDCMQEEPAG